MNALEFFAEVTEYFGIEYHGEEAIVKLPYNGGHLDSTVYYHMYKGGEKYFYDYLILEPRDEKYEWFFSYFMMELERLPYKTQYEIIQRMKEMEMEFEPHISYDELNKWYRVSPATTEKYPLYSVRGTCNMEEKCNCEPVCCKIHDEPFCFNKKVGISKIDSAIKRPKYYEFLPELVIWMALCPDLDALYVMHDDIPYSIFRDKLYYNLAFLLKDNKITYIEDENEMKRLYGEYHRKYPYDTSAIEAEIKSCGGSENFHF